MPFQNKATVWETAPMLRLLLPFALSIVLYDWFLPQFAISQKQFLGFIILFSASLFAILLLVFKRKKGHKIIDFSLPILVLLLGFVCCFQQDYRQGSSLLPSVADSAKPSLAIVSAQPIAKAKTTKYQVAILQSNKSSTAFLYVYHKDSAALFDFGDTIVVPNRWQPIRNAGNPFEMDYARFCARKNIFWQQFVAPNQVVLYGKRDTKTLSFLEKSYHFCKENIQQNIKDSSTKALLEAMLLGNNQDIDPNTRQAYSDTGIIHIVSISGAHVGIFFAFITLCFQYIKRPKHQWLKYLVSLALVWFYVLLAGAPTPALRAAIMFSIVALGHIGKQQSNPLNYLFTAAFAMLLWQPMWLFTIGFQLSFVAVLSILVFYPPLVSFFGIEEKLGRHIKNRKLVQALAFIPNAMAVSIAAEILIAPIVAYYFHSFPPMFLIANVLASLAMTAILVLGLFLILFGKVMVVNTILAALITALSKVFHAFIFALQSFNIELFKTISLSFFELILLLGCIAAFAIFVLRKRQKALWRGLSALLVISIFSTKKSFEIAAQEKLIVYNSSAQAQIELIKGNRYEVLYGSAEPNFATKNAHLGFGAMVMDKPSKRSVIVLSNQKILIMDSSTKNAQHFPIDMLIIASLKKFCDIDAILEVYTPKQVIVSNAVNKYQLARLEQATSRLKIKLHNTKVDGAFCFP